mmetsp:Transcript_3377/g.5154  ORF Transcript_3377/g.5154 Transcript_3377/m.5154 type:complete len:364 (+) Transcript_3377:1128-2219(+)
MSFKHRSSWATLWSNDIQGGTEEDWFLDVDSDHEHHPADPYDNSGYSSHELRLDVAAGRNAIQSANNASFWGWDGRWPTEMGKQAARDGFPIYVKGTLPKYCRKQRKMPPDMAERLADKIHDQRVKTYIAPADQPTQSDVDYFGVPKTVCPETNELLDICIVFNGTSSGLNDSVWAPSFWLPTPDTALRQLEFRSHCVDFDMGEFFLNFPLDKRLRQYTGVPMNFLAGRLNTLDKLRAKENPLSERLSPAEEEVWTPLLMGFTPSPYLSVRHYYLVEEFVIGNPKEEDNPLRWDRVLLNCPGDTNWDPRQPEIMKWDDISENVSPDELSQHSWMMGEEATRIANMLGKSSTGVLQDYNIWEFK